MSDGVVSGLSAAGHPLARTLRPWRLGSLEVAHRVVMGSMHTGLELVDDGGAALAAFWRERVEGGAALIITGGLAVNSEGRGAADYAVLGEAVTDARFAFAVDAVHAAGGLISAQLFHAGRYALLGGLTGPDGSPAEQVAPSPVPWRAARGAVPRELSDAEIWRTIGDFAAAARTAVRLGFDAVEIMASEGYLINQFCSPLTNLRNDEWGGDAVRRRRFAREVLAAVRAAVLTAERPPAGAAADGGVPTGAAGDGGAFAGAVGDGEETDGGEYRSTPVAVRVSGDDLMPGSSTADEVDALVSELVEGGVDAISVGVGWHESRVPTVQAAVPHGAWLGYAERIAGVVRASAFSDSAPWSDESSEHSESSAGYAADSLSSDDSHDSGDVRGMDDVGERAGDRRVAVIASNRMTDLRDAEEVLRSGLIDAVALARPFLADPQIVARSLRGEFDRVNTCIGCNQACIDRSLIGARVSCLVNPRAGNEHALPLTLTRRPTRLAVVGAGPAGLAAAVDAARRGYDVTLFDAAPEPGGQFGLAARIPGKEDYAATPRAALAELRAAGSTLRFGAPVTVADLVAPTRATSGAARPFDAVILATGVIPRHIDLPGADLPHVISYERALREGVPDGSVAIIGGGGIGIDVAAFLTEPAFEATRATEFARHFDVLPAPDLVGTDVVQRATPALANRPEPRPGDLVTLLRRSGRFGDGIGISSRWVAVGSLKDAGVRMIGGVHYRRITPTGIELLDAEGEELTIPAGTVIVCAGQESHDPLAAELERAGIPFAVVGGAHDARSVDAVRATSEGLAAARLLAP